VAPASWDEARDAVAGERGAGGVGFDSDEAVIHANGDDAGGSRTISEFRLTGPRVRVLLGFRGKVGFWFWAAESGLSGSAGLNAAYY